MAMVELKNIRKKMGGVDILNGVDLSVEEGEVVVILGPSGSGKTTIASLIPRFYDTQEGTILIGGTPLDQIERESLMKQVAFVFQNPKLRKATLEDNIRGGCHDADRNAILRAAHLAQCDDILNKLPDGLDSVVGKKGVYLSGGEVQRIAIARAILKNAPILVLDEATAFADPENEAQLQKALAELQKGKTVIMVAHRLSTVQNADQILVMKEGSIVERGTHEKLLELQGEYARMWEDYNQSISWKLTKEVRSC